MKSYTSSSPAQTKKIAKALALTCVGAPRASGALVIALEGELGAGKTTFTQGFAQGLGVVGRVLSPTFVIKKEYKIAKNAGGFLMFHHLDCYRLKNSRDLAFLGWKDLVKDKTNIILLELADRVQSVLPKDAICIAFSHKGISKRALIFSA